MSSADPPPPTTTSEIRSPSPQKPSSSNILGLGLPPPLASTSTTASTTPLASSAAQPSVLVQYPHLAHYVFHLLVNLQSSPPRPPQPSTQQHPLSVSSSGEESDEDDSAAPGSGGGQQTPRKGRAGGEEDGGHGLAQGQREELVRKVVEFLDREEEEEVKGLLRPHMGELGKDEILMDQVCLNCMHRRRDDLEHVPYAPGLSLTPTRARASPSINSIPLRPYTPTRLPSFRARTPLGRPQSPSLPAVSSSLARVDPSSSPSLQPPSTSSAASSPIASPKMLNAKAALFNPSPRASGPPSLASPAASDPWRDAPAESPRSASPFGNIAPPAMARTSSNLAIAAPLFSNHSSPFHSPISTPQRSTIKMPPEMFASPANSSSPVASAPSARRQGILPDDDDDDEFSPFGAGLPRLHHHDPQPTLNLGAKPFQPSLSSSSASHSSGGGGGADMLSSSIPHSESSHSHTSSDSGPNSSFEAGEDPTDASAGMTPLDVLHQVFTSIPRHELEDALHRSGYDFESAMALLVSQYTHPRSGSSTPQRVASPRPGHGMLSAGPAGPRGAGVLPRDGYFSQGGRGFGGPAISPGLGGMGARSPGGVGTRMCRYYLAGECRRSDCRFSHDLDRALCRFWLRGHCAKGPNCEFLHHFPNNIDPHALSNAMSRLELSSDGSAHPSATPPLMGPLAHTPQDEFPDLLSARLGRQSRFDPSRNRFANAVKRAGPPGPIPMPSVQITGARMSSSLAPVPGTSTTGTSERTTPLAVPRPSQRIKLRPPLLLPTLKTGQETNDQYLSFRSTAIRLGHARNACLARAADAFRRGDGAAAKRFSREGKSLNERMLNEAAEAAQSLVRERRAEAQEAVRARSADWSDDPMDRGMRGKECAGGLGVVLGVAPRNGVPGGDRLSVEERTEVVVDLHTLHGSEAGEVLGQFLAELERENFRGLAYIVVGDERHVGTQDPLRGTSKVRLGAAIKQCLAEWGYPWNEAGGVLCVDPCRF